MSKTIPMEFDAKTIREIGIMVYNTHDMIKQLAEQVEYLALRLRELEMEVREKGG